MTNDEACRNDEARITKAALPTPSWFVIPSSLDIRHSPFLRAPTDPSAMSPPPVAYNETDRATDSAGPARIPLHQVLLDNRPSAAVTGLVSRRNVRLLQPCARRGRAGHRAQRFGVTPRLRADSQSGGNENNAL